MHEGSFAKRYEFKLRERFSITITGEPQGARLLPGTPFKVLKSVRHAYESLWFTPTVAGTHVIGVFESLHTSPRPAHALQYLPGHVTDCTAEDIIRFLSNYWNLLPSDGVTVFLHRPFYLPRANRPDKKHSYLVAFSRNHAYATRRDQPHDPYDTGPRRYYVARCIDG